MCIDMCKELCINTYMAMKRFACVVRAMAWDPVTAMIAQTMRTAKLAVMDSMLLPSKVTGEGRHEP